MTSPENQRKHDPHKLEGVKKRGHKVAGFPWLRVSFFILVCGLIIIAQGPLPEKIWRKIKSLQKDQQEQPSPQKVSKPDKSKPPEPA
ncbi:MAG: hypothetical protein KJO79_04015, partial [Verrucomicrobiae bacterium]|nr:hypothetical protein [Verrucomicrobiae bacterium]NNJ86325.1 hypothetical protein [Akkermansiaceae bacterium]